jgi:CRISPR system Cascade subunit CasE
MYFSRVRIRPYADNSRMLMQLFRGDIYTVHKLIWSLFPNRPDASRDFLYRQEFENEQLDVTDQRRGIPLYYVVSEQRPVRETDLLIADTKVYEPKLSTGMFLNFSVRINPIVARHVTGKKNSQKHDVLMDVKYHLQNEKLSLASIHEKMDDAAVQWLIGQGQEKGFVLPNPNRIEVSEYLQQIAYSRNRKITFSSVNLTGVLQVTESEQFFSTLVDGIGSSRAFGCGLMLIRRI